MKAYDYNANQNFGAGLSGAEVDWEQYHQLHGAGAAWVEVKIPVVPNCPFRMVYLLAYNDVATIGAYVYGEFKAVFNNRITAKIPFTFSGTSGVVNPLSGLPTGGLFHPAFSSGVGNTADDCIFASRIGQAGFLQLTGFKLVVTADTLIWTPLQQVASAGNACTIFACKSMRDTF